MKNLLGPEVKDKIKPLRPISQNTVVIVSSDQNVLRFLLGGNIPEPHSRTTE